jgi:hypothetical protein
MRGGYLLMGVGLAVVKWPLLPGASDLPLFEGVTLCLLTAMSAAVAVRVCVEVPLARPGRPPQSHERETRHRHE